MLIINSEKKIKNHKKLYFFYLRIHKIINLKVIKYKQINFYIFTFRDVYFYIIIINMIIIISII